VHGFTEKGKGGNLKLSAVCWIGGWKMNSWEEQGPQFLLDWQNDKPLLEMVANEDSTST
jgi:hypothetical protein